MIQISEPHAFMLCFLCGFCNRKSDELPVLYLRVSSTIKVHIISKIEGMQCN